jgi:hypothetical protein
MNKKILALCIIPLLCGVFFISVFAKKHEIKIPNYNYDINSVEPMPIIKDDPYSKLAHGGSPVENRNIDVRRWLSAGVKISVKGSSGSGTIVYYDSGSGYAYVQSCGHLWSGNMTAAEGELKKLTCEIITWYHNDKKLENTKTYPAEVLYYINNRGQDCSLVRFKPDWVPNYFAISPSGFRFVPDTYLHSVGCDGGREIAHYDVRVLGERDVDVITTENSPRPGRSGGGLMSDDYYVGVCWGTTDLTGSGNGLFTPLKVVRELNAKNGYGWLNDVGLSWARKLPIIDRNNPQGQYPPDYIPLPKSN